jgi:hypothetical protein
MRITTDNTPGLPKEIVNEWDTQIRALTVLEYEKYQASVEISCNEFSTAL